MVSNYFGVGTHYFSGSSTSGLTRMKRMAAKSGSQAGNSSGSESDSLQISGKSSSEVRSQISQTQAQITRGESQVRMNYSKMTTIQTQMQRYSKDSEDSYKKAEEEKTKQTSKFQEDVLSARDSAYQLFESKLRSGTKVTKSDLRQYLNRAVSGVKVNFSAVELNVNNAQNSADKVDSLASDVSSIAQSTQGIENQLVTMNNLLGTLNSLLEELLAAEKQNTNQGSNGSGGSNSAGASDPIGFQWEGETYEFVRDNNENGKVDAISEFLGAEKTENGEEKRWSAMTELNENGDDKVDISELNKGNVKIVNSKGEFVDIEKTFGKDFAVNVNSYNEGGTRSFLDATKHTQLGTYGLTIKGKKNVDTGFNTIEKNSSLLDKISKWSGTNDNQIKSNNNKSSSLSQELQEILNNTDSIVNQNKSQDINSLLSDMAILESDLEEFAQITTADTLFKGEMLIDNQEREDEQAQQNNKTNNKNLVKI